MTDAGRSQRAEARRTEVRRIPIDEAELEAWRSETLTFPTEVPRPVLDPQTEVLRGLMQSMRDTLVPVEPAPNFVRDLGQSLTVMASQRQMPFRQRYGRALMFGIAAAGSVVSVVSVGAYWYYRRESQSHLEQS
jgi:hypothetical protein